MANYQQKEMERQGLNEIVSHKVSIYSQSLRDRLGNIADFKSDFNLAFDGFVENTLPRDDLYKQIEDEFEAKRKKKKAAAHNSLLGIKEKKPDDAILPDPDEKPHEKVTKKVANFRAQEEMARIKEHEDREAEEKAKTLT